MLVSFFLLLLLTVGGFALTYLFARSATMLWRLCVGHVVGSVVFGLIAFLLAPLVGFTTVSIALFLTLALAPLAVFARKDFRREFSGDWRAAGKTLENTDFNKIARVGFYIFFLILFWFFFQRAIIENGDGISIGSSHNLGDLPFHLGAIFSFSDGQNFPPENPSFAFAKFTYPFMVDLITASLVKFGARVSDAMLVQNVFLAFSLLVILERFTFKLMNNRLAARLAPVLLFFCGGFGFLWFFKDMWNAPDGVYKFLWNIPYDYTIRPDSKFRWCNSLTALFLTQRSLLLGMPLVLVALDKIWDFFSADRNPKTENQPENASEKSFSVFGFPLSVFIVGLLAGTLPLVHSHSIVALFLMCACLFAFSLHRWREWTAFGVGVAAIAVPELAWATTGSATNLAHFFRWELGWVVEDEGFFKFWALNLGIFLPLLISGVYLAAQNETASAADERSDEQNAAEKSSDWFSSPGAKRLFFFVAALSCFIFPNVAQLAPWNWDNIKILIYWFVGSVPFVAYLLAWLWEKKGAFKIVTATALVALTLSGAIDVWRVASRAMYYGVFEADAVRLAAQIKEKTPPRALFLNAPVFATATVLSGRRSFMRFSGHLWSYGINYEPRENELKRIYEGSALAESLLKKYDIEYVVISPEERNFCRQFNVALNEDYFRRFPVVAQAGDYRVYKVSQ